MRRRNNWKNLASTKSVFWSREARKSSAIGRRSAWGRRPISASRANWRANRRQTKSRSSTALSCPDRSRTRTHFSAPFPRCSKTHTYNWPTSVEFDENGKEKYNGKCLSMRKSFPFHLFGHTFSLPPRKRFGKKNTKNSCYGIYARPNFFVLRNFHCLATVQSEQDFLSVKGKLSQVEFKLAARDTYTLRI